MGCTGQPDKENHFMSHHHHDHDHSPATGQGELTEREKVLKLLHHWIHHNDDHAANYSDWARKVEGMGFHEAAQRLRAASEMTRTITREFEAAEAAIRGQGQAQ
jgi:hypothetical protein